MQNELYSFVKESLEKGEGRDAIEQALLQAGWQEEEVKNTLAAFADVQFPVPVPKPKPYLQAREAFLYLISFIALYITAFSFGTLIFAFIDKFFPDPIAFRNFFSRGLTTAIASIIIAFPLYSFMMWHLRKAEAKDPERRQSKVAKWLTYITLVIAAAIIIGDLIAVVSGLLRGEFTMRFILKALTILAITGSIFGYYLWNLRREEKTAEEKALSAQEPPGFKIFRWIVIIVIASSVVYGFILVGSPAQQRLVQFDGRRVSDLQNISVAIDVYWERNEVLPETLEDLQNQPYFVYSIQDPKTGEAYEYVIVSETEYELCAVFETDTVSSQYQEKPRPFSEQIWEHGIGRACFQREAQKPLDPFPRSIPFE